jgi:hypothetical protein
VLQPEEDRLENVVQDLGALLQAIDGVDAPSRP